MREPKDIMIGEFTLEGILERHGHWCHEDCAGWEYMKADLFEADLCGADLEGADLRGADLEGADLRGANLCKANLTDANLYAANLHRANLTEADLLRTNLSRAILTDADLQEAKNIPYIPMACPDMGSFTGWKQCRNGRIVQLEIPADAKRSSATGRKCRCDKAKVISIRNIEGDEEYLEAYSFHNSNFRYAEGEEVSVDDFCEDRFVTCAPGIHFFINRQEAVDYS